MISYSQYKDELIASQRNLVKDLSVPIIPLSPSISMLPLIGTIDQFRSETIEEKVIAQVGANKIEILIIDFSGVVEMENGVIRQLMRTLDGISIMGCQSVITGLRPEIGNQMVRLGISFENRAIAKETLQQALIDYLTSK